MLQVNSVNQQLPASKIQEAILSLKPNQLLMAKILEIFPDQSAKILYEGLTIHAKLDAPLSKGERYLFEVMYHSDNQTIILKKVDADPVRSAPEQILQKLKMPVQKNEIKAVDYAIAEKLPLTKENIKLIADILQQTAGLPFNEKKLVIQQMLRLQLQASPSNIKTIISSINQHNEKMDMKPLFDSLLAVAHKSVHVEKTINLLESLFGLQRNADKLNDKSAASNKTQEIMNTVQNMSNKSLGNGIEDADVMSVKSVRNLTHVQPQVSASELVVQSAVQEKSGRHPASEMFLQAAEKWLKNSGLLHERTLFLNPEQLKHTETLKSQLLFLHQNAEQLKLTDSVKQSIDHAISRITNQQIQNLPSNDGMQQFILQIPFQTEIQPKEMIIRWEGKQANGESLDPEHCRMLFWLEMEHIKKWLLMYTFKIKSYL
ncbi:hypothetical protein [Bacillus sp. NEB1478]|uniref:hypothetical protein n=1 Tax=Bacillus sp. NEB1478 TaxID=3073816 RepID=UPI0028737FBC|nr:hypothetical protein [Bacillus sp. NEB1478]WNB90419.1 hypothetical protein RGB74_10835 [Bacillus sp. NEB1478]